MITILSNVSHASPAGRFFIIGQPSFCPIPIEFKVNNHLRILHKIPTSIPNPVLGGPTSSPITLKAKSRVSRSLLAVSLRNTSSLKSDLYLIKLMEHF